ncbi:FG-GAP-like repeat-containing protein [Polyangium sp. 6x1]|uniref:FG-GAP-like repeat-containing protein n=1 Tax=Polyangium sp. 6x1 TaxID=3042689 RepID=UPI002482D890|nr:FG-GAP-like repeat-containing protein [Polyangium sp. 6x1]MDI1446045.1 FG-GAP-like repeat-containing protein [Polyangium sp. 6x1]
MKQRRSEGGWQGFGLAGRTALGGALCAAVFGCGEQPSADAGSISEAEGALGAANGARLPYPRTPVLASRDPLAHSLGAALADINGDGFPDLVVANGNDLEKHAVTVSYNDGRGHFPLDPSWSSADLDYHTGLAVGDIDADGWIDVVATVGPRVESDAEGSVKVYFNRNGTLESLPSYRHGMGESSIFGCALGDYDGDGDLDLAIPVAVHRFKFGDDGEMDNPPGDVRIFENKAGVLSSSESWYSKESLHATAAKFADVDQDGLLDLVVAARALPIYRGRLDACGAIRFPGRAWWTARPEFGFPAFVDVGKVGASTAVISSYNDYIDVRPDSLVDALPPRTLRYARRAYANYPIEPPPPGSCARGVSGAAPIMAFSPRAGENPVWISDTVGWGSGVRLADVSGDGVLDLLATRWGPSYYGMGAPLEIYLGTRRGFETSPAWTSGTCTIGETILVGDLDRSDWTETRELFMIQRSRAVVTLSRQTTEAILEVERNGRALGSREWTSVPGGNWISFAERLQPGDVVRVQYAYSRRPDIILASTYAPNYVFYRDPAATDVQAEETTSEPDLLRRLEEDPDLRRRFLEDPEAVVSRHALSREPSTERLLDSDEEWLRTCSEEPLRQYAIQPAPWIPPETRTTAPRIAEGRRGHAVTVTYYGAFFPEEFHTWELQSGDTKIPGRASAVKNPKAPQSSVDVTFRLGRDIPTGRYSVHVLDAQGKAFVVRDIAFVVKE